MAESGREIQHKARRAAAILGLVLPILAPLVSSTTRRTASAAIENPTPIATPAADHFSRHIQPVLRTRCLGCHGDEAPAGGLSLTSREHLLAGGDHGPAIVPGEAESSLLYQRIARAGTEAGRMPPGDAGLPAPVIERFATWIRSGATYSSDVLPAREAERKSRDPEAHWAFQPLRAYPVPAVKNPAWVRTPIDRFVLAELERKQLAPAPRAARRQLIRRLYFDMLGLPPPVEEVEAFIGDRSQYAYSRLVDRVLASPHYGERWGRYWLDLARYADSSGYEVDRDRPAAYPYRDFVIRALNEDMPYDQFVKWQVAGDLMAPGDVAAAAATGFCTSAPTVEPGATKKDRLDELDDVVSTASTAFLGLTIGCARCHDHKFDPISQRDYYRMVSVFAGTRRAERYLDSAEGARFERQNAAHRRTVAQARERLEGWLKSQGLTDARDRTPSRRASLGKEQQAQWTQLEESIRRIQGLAPRRPARTLSLSGAEGRETPIYAGADPKRPGETTSPGVPAFFSRPMDELQPEASSSSDGKASPRVMLAEWLVDPEQGAHRLAARSIVNRVWQYHFGQGLVRTPSDLGLQGEAPSHPELLDWLAYTFSSPTADTRTSPVDGAWWEESGGERPRTLSTETASGTRDSAPVKNGLGWSLKRLHRLILNSSVYMQGTRWDAGNAQRDPENRLLWRRAPQRLNAEAIRDAMLSVSGCLNERPYGPGIRPRIPTEAIFKSEAKYGELWPSNVVDGPATWRRSIYVFVKRGQPLPFLQIFDAPEPVAACSQRTVSTVAPQALALLNDPFVRDQAERLAHRVAREAGSDPAGQVDHLYRLALGRPPRATERDACLHFLTRDSSALAELCQTVMGLNEFIYVD